MERVEKKRVNWYELVFEVRGNFCTYVAKSEVRSALQIFEASVCYNAGKRVSDKKRQSICITGHS